MAGTIIDMSRIKQLLQLKNVTSNFESTFFGKGKSTDFCRGFLRSYTRP